jgi:hypothetical protein
VREGFPPEKLFYYKGAMQDWLVLGMTTVPGAHVSCLFITRLL